MSKNQGMKKKILIIGKNSFIGSNLYNILKNKLSIKLITYEEFKDAKKISKFDYICNCSLTKNYQKKKYSIKHDLDYQIAKSINKEKVKYIFLGSRKIYKPQFNIKENGKILTVSNYSKNKLLSEINLKKILKNKLLILRISNIIGLKSKSKRNRNTTFFDNYLKIIKKNNKVFYQNDFKDFLSINQFAKIFFHLIKKDLCGTFNVSLGKKIYIKEIINWLNKYNKNQKIFTQYMNKVKTKDSFTLNNDKLTKKINIKITKTELKKYCLNLSKKIH